MEKIDELILKILKLKPQKLHENSDSKFYLIYKDITLCFWNMYINGNDGLVSINNQTAFIISKKSKKAVLSYFKEEVTLDTLLNKVNNDIRKKKLLNLNEK